ncbi:hypothetical protein B0H14DRAFT_2800986 [Mycena olivaceomarginata]|nr:hypothetical protein B0H14DRAFT_2800986 [Mycena olivaceomarginata]
MHSASCSFSLVFLGMCILAFLSFQQLKVRYNTTATPPLLSAMFYSQTACCFTNRIYPVCAYLGEDQKCRAWVL